MEPVGIWKAWTTKVMTKKTKTAVSAMSSKYSRKRLLSFFFFSLSISVTALRKATIEENDRNIKNVPALLDTPRQSGLTSPVNITLFGYPKTGKTTLFNLLAGAHVEVRAYDDGRREPNIRTVALP